MLIAHYIGDHANDTIMTRVGCAVTRRVQKGEYGVVTHVEAILHDYGKGGLADIASASVRDGGVRIKERVQLDPSNWLITDVPMWFVDFARSWFVAHQGMKYDWRGAWATVMPGKERNDQFFCNEAVGASVGLRTPFVFTPAQFAAIAFTLGRDVTREFFSKT